jgi:hypothetical protein
MVYSEISKLWQDIFKDSDVRLSVGPTNFIIKLTVFVYISFGFVLGILNWHQPPIVCALPRISFLKDPIPYCWDAETHTGIGPDANKTYFSTFKYLPTYYIVFALTFFLSTLVYRYLEGNSISHLVFVAQEVSQKKENPDVAVTHHRVELIFKGTIGNCYYWNYFIFQIFQLSLVLGHVSFLACNVFEYPKVDTFEELFLVFNPFVLRASRNDHLGVIFPKYFGCTMYYYDQGKKYNQEDLLCHTTYIGTLEASVVILALILIIIWLVGLCELIVTQLKVLMFADVTMYDIVNFKELKKLTFSQRLKLILLNKNIDSELYYNVLEKLVVHPKLARKNNNKKYFP